MKNSLSNEGERTTIEEINKIPMLFILGNARSGTTLFQNLLDAHPGIVGTPESQFAVILSPRFAHIKKWKESAIIDFVEYLFIEPLFVELWHLDKKRLTETLLSVIEFANYSLLCKIVYYQMRNGKTNLLYLSDKNPEYILYINTILRLFPESKFIHLVRDPRDVIYSQVDFFKEKNAKFRAFKWMAFNLIVEKRKRKNPDNYFTLKYEILVNDTEATMRSICDFLKIPYVDSMSQNKSPVWVKETIVPENAKPFISNLSKPVNTSRVANWKNKMNIRDLALTEIITGDFANKTYGYEIDFNRKNKPVKISISSLLKGRFVYYIWQNFKQLKAKSLRFNLFYVRLRVKLNPHKVRPSKYL